MAVFENCSVLLELKHLSFKEKKEVKSAVIENGGNISFVVNKQCSLVVTSDVCNLSTNRLRSIRKYHTPVVGLDYVYSCVNGGRLLPVDEYKLDTLSSSAASLPPPPSPPSRTPHQGIILTASGAPTSQAAAERPKEWTRPADSPAETPNPTGLVLEKFRIYKEADSDLPTYPDHFQVAKYLIFEKMSSSSWCVLELQSVRAEGGRRYRVVSYWKDDAGAPQPAVKDVLVFLSTSEDALQVYQALRDTLEASGLQSRSTAPPLVRDLGSAPLQQLLLEEKLNTGSVSQEVGVFVELLWTEALGRLNGILTVPISRLSLNDVTRVEALLLQAQKKLREQNAAEVLSLLNEVYVLLPHREPASLLDARGVSQKLDLCQLIRDVLNVSEVTQSTPSCLGKYRALRCSIETAPPGSSDFHAVTHLLHNSNVQIQQVLRINRGVELQTFRSEFGNIKPLLHSSSPNNFVGILSRGLLLPRVGVEHHGIERTDVGNLGSGIYFSDAVSGSLKYSKPSVTDGSRLLVVCDVALGQCKDVHKRDITLTQPPEGHHSVHGVRRTVNTHSEFEDDEYVVYSPDQVRLKYVVQFSIEGDQPKTFSPALDMSADQCVSSADRGLGPDDDNGVEYVKNPLADVAAGLLDSCGQQLPLQAVHVKCRLMDLLSQVIIFQKYTNRCAVAIEAKYVFPLDGCAAVCGFEAFIGGKRVVGQVREKERARREYKEAIESGHGAYMMDQDAPDVFTISVGNLPPAASVLIKVTLVSELTVRDGNVLFSLPGSVAPWQQSAALNQTTQVSVEKVCVTDEAAGTREFSLDMSLEMPHEIRSLQCFTHRVKIKKTACKAVLSVLPGETMGPDGFQLSVSLSDVHLPRMWVENHPDKDSQACMLVFYPDFEASSSSAADEVVLLLDTSESMKGASLGAARRVALQVLKNLHLHHHLRLNVTLFGTDHTDAFLIARPVSEGHQAAESFIQRSPPVGGSTELWRPLRALSLLPPSRGIRNLLLLSDGHIQHAELTLQLLRDNAQHSRLFTCGLSPTANRHMLRALAQAGGGAYEFFDTKTKHNWAERVACQVKRMASPGCSSVSVKWQQFNTTASPPLQAPRQLPALFSDCHTLVYGFVPHCTQATLLGNLSGQELRTMVSTSELQKTRGTFVHRLTARALIKDYEDGSLDTSETGHEVKKAELKSFIIDLSKEFSILSQFTSFVAIEERDSEEAGRGFTDISKLIAEEDVDFLPYISWICPEEGPEVRVALKKNEVDVQYYSTTDDLMMRMKTNQTSPSYSFTSSSEGCSSSSLVDDEDGDMDFCLGEEQDLFMEKGAPPPPPPPPLSYAPCSGLFSAFKNRTHSRCKSRRSFLPTLLYSRGVRSAVDSPDAGMRDSGWMKSMSARAASPEVGAARGFSFESSNAVAFGSTAVESFPTPSNDALLQLETDGTSPRTWEAKKASNRLTDGPEAGWSPSSLIQCKALSVARHVGYAPPTICQPAKSSFVRLSSYEEILKLKWTRIFQIQHSDGFWELTTELGELIDVNLHLFANVFLENKGIRSLGVKAHVDILRLVATLLVLQLMRVEKLEEGKYLRTLFCLEESCDLSPQWWREVMKAVDWARRADQLYPCIYSRLEFGLSWETSTRQLLGYEGLPPHSPLTGLNLRSTGALGPVPVQYRYNSLVF
ncbi:protein mono-ADP-ribosyltransferase PARP4 [Embiotoca jacksoni]|uniref:protein mono-ADP-ribosyltransferase PARP4 n=1 Tax=Embiotoca jacksoni TaxID=100190 RepID=UPI0037045EBC